MTTKEFADALVVVITVCAIIPLGIYLGLWLCLSGNLRRLLTAFRKGW